MSYENSMQIRKTLARACDKLEDSLLGQDRDESPRLQLLLALMIAMREYSKSSNEITGYRGLGLDETLKLAEEVLDASSISERTVSIASYRLIAQSIVISGDRS